MSELLNVSSQDREVRARSFQQVRRRLSYARMRTKMEADASAACLVLLDLLEQGWLLRRSDGLVEIRRPASHLSGDAERERVRGQLHAERDRQLHSSAVHDFISEMEKRRFRRGRWTSVFSLMRDGGDLSNRLRAVRHRGMDPASLAAVIRPYVQVATEGAICDFTGLPLVHIWRYFRHTWANPYNTVPSRSAMFLVRDAAADCHPIVGIFALASSSVQIKVRDRWIGWDPESQIVRLREGATDEDVEWLAKLIQQGLNEIYLEDLLDPALSLITLRDLSSPRPSIIRSLNAYAKSTIASLMRAFISATRPSPTAHASIVGRFRRKHLCTEASGQKPLPCFSGRARSCCLGIGTCLLATLYRF